MLQLNVIAQVLVTDSVPQDEHVRKMEELAVQYGKPSGKLEVLSVGTVFAEVCQLIYSRPDQSLTTRRRQFDVCTTERASARYSNMTRRCG